jgi:hypothetical protein
MVIPSTGPIAFSTLQNEFGGTDPISISEYYKGLLTPNFNTGVPASSTIRAGQFYNTARASTRDEVFTDFDTPTERNYFMTSENMTAGKETSTSFVTYDVNSPAAGRNITSFSTSLSFSSTPIISQRTNNITVIEHGCGVGAAWSGTTVNVNGTAYGSRTIAQSAALNGYTSRINAWNVPLSGSLLSSVSGTVTSSAVNYAQTGQVIVLPGTWTAINSVLGSAGTLAGSTSTSISVQAGDIVVASGSKAWDWYGNVPDGSASTAGYIMLHASGTFWYAAIGTAVARITTTGTFTLFNYTANYVPPTGGDSPQPARTDYYNMAFRLTVFRWANA